jgi:alpha-L-rhamnosidase
MVGLRYLYPALDRCGLQDYAYKILTADGYPGYKVWLEKDATTLWETWHGETSKNHHMYSSFMGWMIGTLAGINLTFDDPAYGTIELRPFLPDGLDWVKATMKTPYGKITSDCRRSGDGTPVYSYTAPDAIHIIGKY